MVMAFATLHLTLTSLKVYRHTQETLRADITQPRPNMECIREANSVLTGECDDISLTYRPGYSSMAWLYEQAV